MLNEMNLTSYIEHLSTRFAYKVMSNFSLHILSLIFNFHLGTVCNSAYPVTHSELIDEYLKEHKQLSIFQFYFFSKGKWKHYFKSTCMVI